MKRIWSIKNYLKLTRTLRISHQVLHLKVLKIIGNMIQCTRNHYRKRNQIMVTVKIIHLYNNTKKQQQVKKSNFVYVWNSILWDGHMLM